MMQNANLGVGDSTAYLCSQTEKSSALHTSIFNRIGIFEPENCSFTELAFSKYKAHSTVISRVAREGSRSN
jgi:hypothetical protein